MRVGCGADMPIRHRHWINSSYLSAQAHPPPEGVLLRMKCEITGEQVTGYWEDVRPEIAAMNLPYYWWKLTRLGMMQLGQERGEDV